ncbi:MAG: hypothetical protein LCH58_13375 [Bacteroidetes bacterium]|uniref:hypothetical protein n=1 Tax=Phnomibacter sp. TaxID=2836217 RepID=UPI002FDEDD5F|nr:hypothetical protein [Bacteroidota bacterium]
METHYLAGYYLLKLKPLDFGDDINKTVWTCGNCLNISAFDNWCLSLGYEKLDKKDKKALNLTDDKINEIYHWTDSRFSDLINGFADLETAKEFKDLFYNSRDDIQILGLYFPQTDAELLIEDFREGNNVDEFNYNNGDIGIRKNLQKKIVEQADSNEEFLGYDFIGVEGDGSFHSFYCSNITKTLTTKFNLKTNAFGLFDEIENREEIRAYLNDPKSLLEPLPYYFAKVTRVKYV